MVVVARFRLGRHAVQVFGNGRQRRRWLTTSQLAELLEVDARIPALALVGAIRLPLEPLREGPDGPWRRARALLGLERADIRLTIVYGIAIGLLSVATPIAVQALVNTVALGAVLDPLLVLTILVAVVLTFAGVVRLLHARVVEAIQARMFIRAAADVTRRLFAASPAELERTSPAELTARFLEVPVLQKAVAVLLVDGLDLVLKLGVGVILLAAYHPTLLLFAVATLVVLALVIVTSSRGALTTALAESDAKYEIVRWLEQTLGLATVVRTAAGRRRALDHADHLVRRYRDARRAQFTKLMRTLAGGIGIQVIGSTALLGLGGALVLGGQLTLGQLVAAELVFASIASALVKLHKQLEAVYDVLASAKKLAGLVAMTTHEHGGVHLPETGGLAITLTGAAVGYRDAPPLLRDVTLALAPGDRIALDGAPGAGKTTLLETLISQHTILDGQLRYDGQDARHVAHPELRMQIAWLRGIELADDTIEGNLRYASPGATRLELETVLHEVGLTGVLGGLPDGLGTRLRANGRPLSATAARRLALARALVARPRLLVVDGGLDDLGLAAPDKERVLDAVFERRDTTIVVITRDPDVRARCNRQLEIADYELREAA